MILLRNITIFLFIFSYKLISFENRHYCATTKESIDTTKIYSYFLVEKKPDFPGGNDSLKKFLDKNLHYNRIQMEYIGIVCVTFNVDAQGNLSKITILGETENKLFYETFHQLFLKMPRWEPGSIKGVKVKTLISIPFILSFK